ncbi:MAG: hypothetical protein K5988_02125 [Lachnospiraceae bacterium]|nr:hypothetical protein [Lachnospiraceae bacterium]
MNEKKKRKVLIGLIIGGVVGAAEPPFRKNEYRESRIAYRLNFCCCASLLA